MRLNDADALPKYTGYALSADEVAKAVEVAPTIDAVPVVHGEWVIDLRGNWACSVCGNDPYHYNMENMNYCPNCGARMEGKDDSN